MTYPNGFLYRKAILAGSARPSSDLTAFPKLFIISADSDIAARTSSQKFQFTEADGVTTAPYGALYWDSSGNLKSRAKFATWPTAGTAGVTVLGYLYYGNAGTDQSNKSGVLDSDTVAYFPLDDTPSGSAGDTLDWSSNNNGTATNGPTSTTGQVGNGYSFDGSDDYVDCGTNAGQTLTNFTVSCIGKATDFSNYRVLVSKTSTTRSDARNYELDVRQTTGKLNIGFTNGAGNFKEVQSAGAVTAGVLFHAAGTYDGTTLKVYRNGSLDGSLSTSVTPDSITGNLLLGTLTSSALFHLGLLDEVFVSRIARSAAWINYDYTDQFSNSSTFTLGAEETSGGVTSPAIALDWTNPQRKLALPAGFLDPMKIWLIGQDTFFGVAGNPTRDFPVPAGRAAPIALRTWTDPVKLNLAGLDQFFAAPGQSPGQHDWPVPAGRTPVVTLKTHAQQTPLNLLGQDTFYASAGQVPTYEFPVPSGRKSAISLRHADNNLLESTLFVVVMPSGQWDWPVPKARSGSVSLLTFTDQFKLELIGQDQFFGVAGNPLTDWPVPRTRKPPPLSFTLMVSPGLNVVPDINLGGAGPVIQGFFIPRIAMGYFPEGEP